MQLLLQQFYNEFKNFEDTINNAKNNKHKEINAQLMQNIEIIIKELQRVNKSNK